MNWSSERRRTAPYLSCSDAQNWITSIDKFHQDSQAWIDWRKSHYQENCYHSVNVNYMMQASTLAQVLPFTPVNSTCIK